MIRVEKTDEPAWLVTNRALHTNSYVSAPASNKPSPWRASQVVDALRQECANKCIYCEGVIDDVAYAAVEHIAPKKLFPGKVLEWSNLGLACTRCNTNKGDYWSTIPSNRLLNPYTDDISSHLQFIGAIVAPRNGSERGRNTIRRLKFGNRHDLVISKMRRIEEIEARISSWESERDADMRELLAEDIREALGSDREFSATLRSYARDRGFGSVPR